MKDAAGGFLAGLLVAALVVHLFGPDLEEGDALLAEASRLEAELVEARAAHEETLERLEEERAEWAADSVALTARADTLERLGRAAEARGRDAFRDLRAMVSEVEGAEELVDAVEQAGKDALGAERQAHEATKALLLAATSRSSSLEAALEEANRGWSLERQRADAAEAAAESFRRSAVLSGRVSKLSAVAGVLGLVWGATR